MRNLIITAAKDNNYFYNEPKWFATSPKGNFMLIESLLGLDLSDIDVMYFGLLKSDLDTYIDENELLKRTKYNWFCRLSPEQVLNSNTSIGTLLLNFQ